MPVIVTKEALVFTSNPLDRAGDLRTDPEWLQVKRGEPQARFLPFWNLQPLLTGPSDALEAALCFLDLEQSNAAGPPDAQEVFLGLDGDAAYFARDVSALEKPHSRLPFPAHFRDARSSLDLLSVEQSGILGQAKALLDWHSRHRFCSACGAETKSVDAGYRRECPSCETSHFPRTDPAVIMLVTKGVRCLLARNKRFGLSHNHSALAGFVEPGESIEETVRREVFEEVGIKIGRVRYVASQPWPFPSSMMIGCFAEAETEEIRADGVEIVSARWFDKKEVSRMLAGEAVEGVKLPRPIAIAFHLIRIWAER
jgi:NAD+ diphosphatase